jgi:prepilin-type N-terminal cleavage/methylation domain-containing protein
MLISGCSSPPIRPWSSGRRLRAQAFTLVELLIVIVIIGILASLLVPALGKAKARAKRIQCMNNERQLAFVWVMYAGDNADRLVLNGANPTGGSTHYKLWVQGAFYNASDNTNSTLLLDPAFALFALYNKSPDIYRCPADRLTVTVSGKVYPKIRSYSLNAFAGWDDTTMSGWDSRMCALGAYKVFKKLTDIVGPAPADMFTFQDVFPDSICWPYFGVVMGAPGTEAFFNYPAVCHNYGSAVGFGDGHVEAHRWRDPRTLAAKSPDYHAHDDKSPYNKDVVWLRVHATSAAH